MKKVYINEDALSRVQSGLKLPKFLYKAALESSTSLGRNDAIPNVDEYPYEYHLLRKRMEEVSDMLGEFGYKGMSEDELESELSKLVTECKEEERPIREFLEKVCFNAVTRLFGIPKETVNLECRLTDKVKCGGVRLAPEEAGEKEYSFEDTEELMSSNKAVLKRRLIDALIQGASYMYSNVHESYIDDLKSVNKHLPKLYNRINVINDYLTFVKRERISEMKPMQGSYVEVKLGSSEEKSSITAQGVIFPLLLRETIRGLFELFSSHGLPSDKAKAMYVIKKADFILAEPWDMRLGIPMWDSVAENIDDTELVPYYFMELVSLPTDEFNASMREILARTKKGERISMELIGTAEENRAYHDFTERMKEKEVGKSLIGDSYFSASELNSFELDGEEPSGEVIEEIE